MPATLQLAWVDNSSKELGHIVERKEGTGAYAEIGRTPANVVTYKDDTAEHGKTYGYRVCAYNAAGNSDYSNEVTIKAPDDPRPAAPSGLTVKAL